MTQEQAHPPKTDRPHIVFLFSDTGGGHRSAAKAIIEAIELEFPNQATCEMVDIFREYGPPPLNRAPEIYPSLSRMQRMWGMGFRLSDGSARTRFFYQLVWPYIRKGLTRLVTERPADLLVSVHQWINAPVARALALSDRRVPFVTVVTDLVSTHAFWYAKQADLIIVPTDVAFQRGLKYDVSADRMRIVGQPVAERFCQPAGDRCEIRGRLGWPMDLPIALLVGGGEGMGPLEPTAKAISAARLPLGMVIVAGRNQKLKRRLERYPWQVPTIVHGFVQEMPDFMRAADVLITKAGPGTISEAFIAGLPMILYSRLAGQEEGNVDYVVDNGAGVWAPSPDQVVMALSRWLQHPKGRLRAAQVCQNLARPRASREIAHLLMEQVRLPVK